MAAGLILLEASVSCTQRVPPAGRPSGTPTSPVGPLSGGPSSRAVVIPPEGALLALGGGSPLLFASDSDDVVALAPGFVGYDLSPNGSQVVATSEERLMTGISYNPDLVLIDTATQDQEPLARTGPLEEFNGPMKWSPDGTALAYVLVRYPVNPAKIHPGPRTEFQTLCVLDLGTRESTCFPELRRVFDLDWSPDGQSLVVSGPGPLPMQIVTLATGRISFLVTLDAPDLKEKLNEAGLDKAVQFVGPAWSPSGRFIAAWVNAPLPVPVIFDRNGQVVAAGHAALGNAYTLSWKPRSDTLLYTSGYSVDEPTRWVLRELHPFSEEDRPLLSEPGRPLTIDFAVSPSGRWLAMLRWASDSYQEVLFVDLANRQHAFRWSNIAVTYTLHELLAWELAR